MGVKKMKKHEKFPMGYTLAYRFPRQKRLRYTLYWSESKEKLKPKIQELIEGYAIIGKKPIVRLVRERFKVFRKGRGRTVVV
jgi:hypothetical protein